MFLPKFARLRRNKALRDVWVWGEVWRVFHCLSKRRPNLVQISASGVWEATSNLINFPQLGKAFVRNQKYSHTHTHTQWPLTFSYYMVACLQVRGKSFKFLTKTALAFIPFLHSKVRTLSVCRFCTVNEPSVTHGPWALNAGSLSEFISRGLMSALRLALWGTGAGCDFNIHCKIVKADVLIGFTLQVFQFQTVNAPTGGNHWKSGLANAIHPKYSATCRHHQAPPLPNNELQTTSARRSTWNPSDVGRQQGRDPTTSRQHVAF